MPQCKECGTSIPEQSRFCLNCGTPVPPPLPDDELPAPVPAGPPPEFNFIQSSLAGGAFLGLLSSLPLISVGCCLWVPGGGSMATILLHRQQPGRKITYGDGAFAGVLSGLFGAVIATLISIPVKMLSARFIESQQASIDQIFQNAPELDSTLKDLLMRVLSPEISLTTVLFTFISNLIVFSLFAMVGGIITAAILERRKAAVSQPPPR